MPSFILKSFLVGAGAISVLAAPAQLARRDAATITQDIKWINSNLTALTEATNKFSGGLVKALPMTKAEGDLEHSIKAASIGAQASDQLNSQDTKQIIAYINTQLEPSITKVLDSLSAKKDQLTKVKLTKVIADDVATLQKLTNTLGATLIQKASADQKDAGKKSLAKIDADFAKATQTWGNSDAGASSARMVRRDAVAIYSDIKAVSGNLTAMTEVTNSWKGGLVQAIPLTNAEGHLEQSIKGASIDAQASQPLTSANSKEIIAFVNTTLEPNINTLLTALSAKKAQFEKVHLTNVVAGDIATLQTLTNRLAATLVNLASADQKDAAKKAIAKIDGDFSKATQTWGTSTAASGN